MKRLITAILLSTLLGCTAELFAQKRDPNTFSHEISFGTGIGTAFKDGSGSDATFWLNYSKYYSRHLGARFGVQYMPSNIQIDQFVTFPMAFSLRTGMRQGNESLAYGAVAAVSVLDSFVWDSDNIFAEMMAAFLLALINRAEVYVGLTPGYIVGDSSINQGTYLALDGNYYTEEHGIRKTRSLYGSADLGINLSWRIWRFTINMNPAIHWNFTDNYHIYSAYEGSLNHQDSSIPFLFSMNFGLGYLF